MSACTAGNSRSWRVLKVMVAFAAVALVAGTVAAEREKSAHEGPRTASTTVGNANPVTQQEVASRLGMPVEKTLPKSGIALRFIPAGTFVMGSPESEVKREEGETQHTVTLTKPFYMGKHEVTQGQWKKVMGSNPSKTKGNNLPVEQVSWHDCTNFMSKLAALEGMPEGSFRLPTEAQWEYACRAGTTTVFCYGNSLDSSKANFNGNGPYGGARKGTYREKTVVAGEFKPNAWGLYDMHGNMLEWCLDWYGVYGGDATDPSGATSGAGRVIRGGSWRYEACICRSATRANYTPDRTDNDVGLRVCMLAGQRRE